MATSPALSKLALGALLLLAHTLPSPAAPLKTTMTSLTMEGRKVVAWYPTEVDRPLPLVLFSHGYGGANVQSMTLMKALAGAGYLVVAPNHKDAATWAGGQGKTGAASFGDPDSWSDKTYHDRFEDMLAVYRAVPQEPKLAPFYKTGPVILAGHSLGGYTALGMAGARSGWKSEIKVAGVLALSPYCAPYVRSGALRNLTAPVMYQGGTGDYGITPTVSRAGGAYDQTPTSKLFINFEGAGHLAWTELKPQLQPQIAQYAIAFCDRYAKGESREVLSQKLAGVSELRVSN